MFFDVRLAVGADVPERGRDSEVRRGGMVGDRGSRQVSCSTYFGAVVIARLFNNLGPCNFNGIIYTYAFYNTFYGPSY
jgi:hypothetical protein